MLKREAFMGQIPLTALHLLGNGIFAFFITLVIDRWIPGNPHLELAAMLPVLSGRKS